MRDALERLLAVEQQAKRIVAQAEEEALRILAQARRSGEQALEEAAAAARQEAEELVRAARKQAEQKRLEMLRAAKQDTPGIGELDGEGLRKAVDRIARVVAWAEDGGQPSGTPNDSRQPARAGPEHSRGG